MARPSVCSSAFSVHGLRRSAWRWATAIAASGILTIYALLIAACSIAWRNFRSGRGDRKGAVKLSCSICRHAGGRALIGGHHAPVFAESDLIWKSLTISALNASALWIFYMRSNRGCADAGRRR